MEIRFTLKIMLFSIGMFCIEIISAQEVEIIDRDQANYLTPINSLSSLRSCHATRDLDWCDEVMTTANLQSQIESFSKIGLDRNTKFDLSNDIVSYSVVDELDFKGARLFVIESRLSNGALQRYPMPFIIENGLWKLTNKYSSDPEFHEFSYLVPPLFDGKGQKPSDTNLFLGFEQPTQVTTELPSGATEYSVHIYYGKTVLPDSFSAELDRQDITHLFAPRPFFDEEVVIPLQPGRNVLRLSINGLNQSGREQTDADRLVFIVP